MIVDAHAHICPRVCGRIAAGATRGVGYGRVSIESDVGGASAVIQAWPPLCADTRHTPEMLLAHMDWVGVDRAVLLQGPFYGEYNTYVQEAVERFPGRFIGAAYFDPWAENADEHFGRILDSQVFRAVKLECSETTGLYGIHPRARLDDVDIAWLWTALEERGLVLALDLGRVGSRSYQTKAVRRIAERHEGLRIVIAHLGQPSTALDEDVGKRRLWEEQIDLGKRPNVWFDTASLPAYFVSERYPFPSTGRYLRAAIERIGPDKILWGTDVPGLLAHATYRQLFDMAEDHLAFLSTEERAGIMGGNALGVYADRHMYG